MPKAIHSIWWDDILGPSVGRSYPETDSLTGEEALIVFMGHGVNRESEVGYSKIPRGLVISYMKPPNCIAILLDEGDNTPTIERNLLRLVKYIDFNSDEWDTELQRAFELLNELIDETSGASLLTNPGVKKLVEDMSNDRVSSITPKHVLRASVRYPNAHDYLGSDDDEVVRMLKDLEDENVIESRTFGRRVECRQCGDSDLTIELLCPRCESDDIHKVYTLFCPKCSNQFHAVLGDDIAEITCLNCKEPVKVGELPILDVEPLCNKCGTASNDPKIVFRCATCSKHLRGADLLAGTGLAYYPKE
ncbi:MAG: TackOD1 domain-containing metal-binding protein [Candidatus Thorarchaeota archaeon]